MQDNQQFEQLMMQYNQLKTGADDIRRMIDSGDFDSAITMLNAREELFLSCKCMRNYLELTPEQETELNAILDEIRAKELENIKILETDMIEVKKELKNAQKTEKIQQAYDFNEAKQPGSIINYSE